LVNKGETIKQASQTLPAHISKFNAGKWSPVHRCPADPTIGRVVGYTEVIIMPISDKTANQIATLFHCYSSQE